MRSSETHRVQVHNNEEPFLAVTASGGAPFAVGWDLGMCEGLDELGIPMRQAEMVGTSAGSIVTSCLATEISHDTVTELPQIEVPTRDKNYLQGITREVFEGRRAQNVRSMAWHVRSFRPVKLRGLLLSEMTAASCAVPRLFPSVRLDPDEKTGFQGGEFCDGGVRSVDNLDVAPRARHMIALIALGRNLSLPIALPGLPMKPIELPFGIGLDGLALIGKYRWQHRHHGQATIIEPNDDISKLVRKPKDLFDKGRAVEAYYRGKEQAARVFARNEHLQRIAGEAALRRTTMGMVSA